MKTSFDCVYAAYGRLLGGLAVIAGAICFAMMVMVSANAFTRKLLNLPITGTSEFSEAMLVAIVFFGVAFTQARRGHVRVVLATRRLPPRVQQWLHVLGLIGGAALFAWAAWAAFGFALESWDIQEEEWGAVRFPLYPVKFTVFAGVVLLSLQFLLDAVHELLAPPSHAPLVEGKEL